MFICGCSDVFCFQLSAFQRFSIFLTVWLLVVEPGTQLWYWSHERAARANVEWAVPRPALTEGPESGCQDLCSSVFICGCSDVFCFLFPAFQRFSIFLTVWLLVVEADTQLWYWSHERAAGANVEWSVPRPALTEGPESGCQDLCSSVFICGCSDVFCFLFPAFQYFPDRLALSSGTRHPALVWVARARGGCQCGMGGATPGADRRSGIGLPGSVFICVHLWLFRCLLLSVSSFSAFQYFPDRLALSSGSRHPTLVLVARARGGCQCGMGGATPGADRRSGIGLPGSVFICVDLWLFRCLLLSAFSVSAFQLFSFSF